MPETNPQLPLGLKLKDGATFASFFPGSNAELVEHLSRLSGSPWQPGIYLWGDPGTGKSHLLQAVCHAAGERGLAAVYLPLRLADQFPREVLLGLEKLGIVCIDDIQLIAGDQDWELALIQLFERIRDSGTQLVVASNASPAAMGLSSPHLVSRLSWGLQFHLQALDAEGKLGALQLRAARRGIGLPSEAGRYLVRHYGQDVNLLFSTLDCLDRASLVAKRKLTLPFIRKVLEKAGPKLP
jgi:DnaA family protein